MVPVISIMRNEKGGKGGRVSRSDANCKPGEGIWKPTDLRKSGDASCSGLSKITTAAECEAAAEYNRKNNIDKNRGYGGRTGALPSKKYPPGCYYWSVSNKYYFNDKKKSRAKCGEVGVGVKYICKAIICIKCPINHYSEGGVNAKCIKCKADEVTDAEQSKCFRVNRLFEEVAKELDAQKEKQNDLSIKNSRLWQKEQIRLQHDKYMQERKEQDDKNEKEACKNERDKGTILFPAIEISNEIEKIEDTTCIDTNRDELLKSFCSFTSNLDKLFKIEGIDKEAKSFWPNICCKERKDKTLEVCKDPTGRIGREDIIPFALSQGGAFSRHNLYVEVTETIKKNGLLHKGLIKLLESLKNTGNEKVTNAKKLINAFFNDVALCGPRIVDAPGVKGESKLCELFIPYRHSMNQFYQLIESLYVNPLPVQTPSFLETMERSLRKRSNANRLGKTNNMQQIMQAKPGSKTPKAEQQCNHLEAGSKWTSDNLAKMKERYCTGYNHLDLSTKDIKNIAVHYLKKDILYNDKEMLSLSKQIRYQVTDASCPVAPLFEAKDISIQQVAMDTLGNETEWVAVVKLNTQDSNGYLESELPYCNYRKYLIGASVNVKTYIVKNNQCCDGLQDYEECKKTLKCELSDLKAKNQKHYSKKIVLTGTQYEVADLYESDGNRRKLLSGRGSANSC